MRIAVVAGPAPGHAFPAAGLAGALRERGHDVVVLTGERWLPALRRAGLAADELPLLAPTTRDGDFGYLLWGRSVEMAPAVTAQLRSYAVDAVVCDTLTVAGGFAAELVGVPWAELVPHPLPDPSRGLPPAGSGLAPGRTPLGRARDAALRRLTARSLRLAAGQRAAARRALGLRGPGGPLIRLVATLPALEPPRPDWPGNATVVGPLEWDPVEVELASPAGTAPLVVVSASTAPSGATGLLEAALTGLAGAGVRLACTRLAAVGGDVPGWATVGPGRQEALLAGADVVVSGAGHGIVAKALVRGIPLVLVPGGGDQRENAMRVARLGAGVVVPPGDLGPVRLAEAVRRVLTDGRYAEAARRAASTAAGLGPAYAAAVVEEGLWPR